MWIWGTVPVRGEGLRAGCPHPVADAATRTGGAIRGSLPTRGDDTSSVIRLAGDRRMPFTPCGTRKTLRAYAIPRVFRPLRKKRTAFLCQRQRQYAFLLKEKA